MTEQNRSVRSISMSSESTASAWMRDLAMVSPKARAWPILAMQLVLIVLWHPLVFMVCEQGFAGTIAQLSGWWYNIDLAHYSLSDRTVRALGDNPWLDRLTMVVGFLATIILEGCIAYIPFRFVAARVPRPFTLFMRSWWRACLWGTLLLPAASFVFDWLPRIPILSWLQVAPLGYLLLAPALAARDELRPKPGLSKWRPVCPECGYSVRRAATPRCPECGTAFPTDSRVFRRWAVLRLPWDRLNRRLFSAYVATVCTILFCPCRAGRSLAIPDRMERALRWAAAHVLLGALLATLAGSDRYFRFWIPTLWKDQAAPAVWSPYATNSDYFFWLAQSFIAWVIVLSAIPLLGIVLLLLTPYRYPVASRGQIKWTLYLSSLLTLLAAFDFAIGISFLVRFRGRSGFVEWLLAPWRPTELATLFGIWWAVGCATNFYLRRRGRTMALRYAVLYIAAWLILTRYLFPIGAIDRLL